MEASNKQRKQGYSFFDGNELTEIIIPLGSIGLDSLSVEAVHSMKSMDWCLLMKIYSIAVNLEKESNYLTVGNLESTDGSTAIVPGSHK